MREIFVQRRIRVASELVRQFVEELGVYSPGAFVIMKNGDLGLVIKRGLHAANAPVVSCFANAERQPYASPVIHDTGEAGRPCHRKYRRTTGTGAALTANLGHGALNGHQARVVLYTS